MTNDIDHDNDHDNDNDNDIIMTINANVSHYVVLSFVEYCTFSCSIFCVFSNLCSNRSVTADRVSCVLCSIPRR